MPHGPSCPGIARRRAPARACGAAWRARVGGQPVDAQARVLMLRGLHTVKHIGVLAGTESSWFDKKLNLLAWQAASPHEVDGWVIPAVMNCPRILMIRSRYYDKSYIPEDVLKLDYDTMPLWPAEWPDSIKAPGFIFTILFAPYLEAPKIVDNLALTGEWGEYCMGIAKFIAYAQPLVVVLNAFKNGFGNFLLGVLVSESFSYACCLVFYSTGWYFTPDWAMKLLVSWRLLVMVFFMPLGLMRALFTHAKQPPLLRRQSSTARALEALRYGLLQ